MSSTRCIVRYFCVPTEILYLIASWQMDNALIDDRRIHVGFSQSVAKLLSQDRRKDNQPGKGKDCNLINISCKYTYVEGKKELNNELNLSAKELIGHKSSSPFSDKEDGIIVNAMPNELETTKCSL
jgi:hypothetical protein